MELCTRHSLRVVARMVNLGRETVRKFILRKGVPNLATRRRFAELFLETNAEDAVVDVNAVKVWRVRPRLMELLPSGEDPARKELSRLFELMKRFPDEVPLGIDRLHEWMDLQIRGEYWAEDYYGAIGRGEREHDELSFLANIPKRTRKSRKKAPDEGSGE